LDKTVAALNRLADDMEAQIEASENHASQIWFAWGLLDVHVKNLRALVECSNVDQLHPVLLLIEEDCRHLLQCLQRHPLDVAINRRLVQWLFRRGRVELGRGLIAVHTIVETQVQRVKRRRLL
jgi:hypothetical protein